MGDINVNILQENNDNTNIEEFLSCFNISRLKLPPTRITNTTSTSIDWICTNIEPENNQTSVIASGLSDHSAQLALLNLNVNIAKSISNKKRNFSRGSIELLQLNLRNQDWKQVHQTEEVNSAYNIFNNIIQSN
uniref:Endonuclease/exonuclease/phosphatase domain-containing protein n=1 Tax=Graphocephala atropunctata TaxID=36148 RepID=A0A1B6L354_9HEMI